jgi:hypothetical protein
MNIDYAVCQALSYRTTGLPGAVTLYDIVCKWLIYFLRRIREGKYLSIPEFEQLIGAVGKFHISAHVKECFEAFSPNFIKGIGQVDGEILETLWSSFNPIARLARTMSKAHRREIYDDHMRDANWKKLVGSGRWFLHNAFTMVLSNLLTVKSLLTKSRKAAKGSGETKASYQDLTSSISEDLVKVWEEAEKEAMEKRGKFLNIFVVQEKPGTIQNFFLESHLTLVH